MQKVRAKFICNSVENQPEYQQNVVTLTPVIEGSDENKSFAKYTPAGLVELCISDETEASNAFEEGKEYYLDFTPA